MTTVLPMTVEPDVEPDADAGDGTPGCGCCIPPPGAGAKNKVLAELAARKADLDRRLEHLSARA
jgi:hypothetical protein